MSNQRLAPATLAAQGLGMIEPVTKAVVQPIHVSTTFERDADNQYSAGRCYSRADNPTFDQVEATLAALEQGNLDEFARLMDVHWQRKKARSSGMSNAHINEWYDHAMANGALGGKLIGAGGGGFLMFYAGEKQKLRHAMREKGLQEVRFRFDFEGCKVVAQN